MLWECNMCLYVVWNVMTSDTTISVNGNVSTFLKRNWMNNCGTCVSICVGGWVPVLFRVVHLWCCLVHCVHVVQLHTNHFHNWKRFGSLQDIKSIFWTIAKLSSLLLSQEFQCISVFVFKTSNYHIKYINKW